MKNAFFSMIFVVGLFCAHVSAAPAPCLFGGYVEGSSYEDLGALYAAADLVIIGQATGKTNADDLVFSQIKVLKGTAGSTIILHGHRMMNTEINGFILPYNKLVVLFLIQGGSGVFDSVENYNSGCLDSFFIQDKEVVLIEADANNKRQTIPVTEFAHYLASHPQRLVRKN